MTDAERLEALCRAVRHCRDQRGDDRCWKDWEAVYALLPEGYTPPVRDETVELEACRDFIRSCHDPRVRYVSPQVRIAELEAELARLKEAIRTREDVALDALIVHALRGPETDGSEIDPASLPELTQEEREAVDRHCGPDFVQRLLAQSKEQTGESQQADPAGGT